MNMYLKNKNFFKVRCDETKEVAYVKFDYAMGDHRIFRFNEFLDKAVNEYNGDDWVSIVEQAVEWFDEEEGGFSQVFDDIEAPEIVW